MSVTDSFRCPACGRYPATAPAHAKFPCAACGQEMAAPDRPCPKRCRCEKCRRQSAGMFADDLVETQPEMF